MADRKVMWAGLAVIAGLIVLALVARELLLRSGYGTRGKEPPQLSAEAVKVREDMLEPLYFACMDEMKDEDFCLNRFGRMTWYPRNALECEGIGARVDKVIALGGEPKWRDLFKNERCARRGQPYSAESVNPGELKEQPTRSDTCDTKILADRDYCYEEFGTYYWSPHEDCPFVKRTVRKYLNKKWDQPPERRKPIEWNWYFWNERCWRVGKLFHEPELP